MACACSLPACACGVWLCPVCVGLCAVEMNAEQRESLSRDGYLIVRNAISPELVAALNKEVDLRLQYAARGTFPRLSHTHVHIHN